MGIYILMPNKKKLLHNKHKVTGLKDASREKKLPFREPCTTTRAAKWRQNARRAPRTWTVDPPFPAGFFAPHGLTLQLFHDSSLDSSSSPLNGATSWGHHTQHFAIPSSDFYKTHLIIWLSLISRHSSSSPSYSLL